MIDSPFDFIPVPVRTRRDGWTAERQRFFIAALRQLRSPTRAARAVGMSREGAYALRRHRGAAGFRAAWDAALADATPKCQEPTPLARALEGVAQPYFYGGRQRGEWRRYDDDALARLLRRLERRHGSSTILVD